MRTRLSLCNILLTALLGLTLGGGAVLAGLEDTVEDNIQGLAKLRADVMGAIKAETFGHLGPWNLHYVGPRQPGTLVFLRAEPQDAFTSTRTEKDGYEVRLEDPARLFTKITGDLRPVGIRILKTFEGIGEGRVYVTFENKKGGILDLEELDKKAMVRKIEWTHTEAVTFLGYVGKEAAFLRKAGHRDTPVKIRLTIEEEEHLFRYSEWLPRTGPAPRPRRGASE